MQKKVGNTILQDLRVMDNVEIDGQTGTPSYRDAGTNLKREEEQRQRGQKGSIVSLVARSIDGQHDCTRAF